MRYQTALVPVPEEALQPMAYKVEEVAEMLKLSRNTVYQLIYDGRLRPVKIGRKLIISGAEVQDFLARETQKAEGVPTMGRQGA